ncbi:MAG: hypothetical protein JWM68_1675 [Verrucomicrobiales bacterium]|nr:hypothetical protein [Verrucomicrobiales bacterium]
MPTPFDQLLKNLQAAQGDTAKLALVTFDFAVAGNPTLRAAAEMAAIPHWFDAKTLAALLPEQATQAENLVAQLAALPMIEPYHRAHGDPAWNVHEATRLALRDRLLANEPERFRQLSRRAAASYGSANPDAPDFALTCEHLYHQLAGQTDAGDVALDKVSGNWRADSRVERLQTLARLLEELLVSQPAPPLLPRGQGLSYMSIAAARENHQSTPATVALLKKAEVIFRELVASDPDNAARQRDLSVSYNGLGDLAVAQGQLDDAARAYADGLTIRKKLAASNPSNTQWQRDLSVSYVKLGSVAVAQRQFDVAARAYADGLTIHKKLAASDPGNSGRQRDLSISYERLGDVAVTQGQLDEAARAYGERLMIAKKLTAGDPSNTQWQRDLSISYERLGNVAVAQGQLKDAARAYGDGLKIRKKLTARDPGNTQWQRDLSISFFKISKLQAQQQQWPEALANAEASLKIDERLSQHDPSIATWQQDVKASRAWVEKLRQMGKGRKGSQGANPHE